MIAAVITASLVADMFMLRVSWLVLVSSAGARSMDRRVTCGGERAKPVHHDHVRGGLIEI
jgi:hypothetical protein